MTRNQVRLVQKRHRKKRRLLGMCGWFGCYTITPEHYYCENHRMAHAVRMRLTREKARLLNG